MFSFRLLHEVVCLRSELSADELFLFVSLVCQFICISLNSIRVSCPIHRIFYSYSFKRNCIQQFV